MIELERIVRLEQATVTFEQFCCILTEFRNLPPENQHRLWDVLVGKAAALLHSVVSPVSRILCTPLFLARSTRLSFDCSLSSLS